jgi:hypothetical protein
VISRIFGAFVFPPELLAVILAFPSHETLGATVLSIIAFSWLGTALVTYTSAPDPLSSALGVLNLTLALILPLLGVVGVLGKPLLASVMFLAFRFGSNALYRLTARTGVQIVSGVIGCAIILLCMVASLLASKTHRSRLCSPSVFMRSGPTFEGDLNEQVGPVEKEADVRKQL